MQLDITETEQHILAVALTVHIALCRKHARNTQDLDWNKAAHRAALLLDKINGE